MTETRHVEIVEVGPRDGLQNEARAIPVADKIAFIDALSSVGFRRIEAGSFVSPRWVPQMAGSRDVLKGIKRADGVRYLALTPNRRGIEDAIDAKVDEAAVFASASEGFSRANVNASIDESLARFPPVIARAREVNIPVRGYISCVTDCPYDGPVAPEAVLRVALALRDMGCREVSLGDTIGRATPDSVDRLIAQLLEHFSPDHLAGHFHDTSGRALDNVGVCLARGIRTFDASTGGLGGCPYAPGAAGNVASEALAAYLTAAGFEHGLDPDRLAVASAMAHTLREGAA